MQKFDENVALFGEKNPKASALLSFASTKHIHPCTTEKGEPNLKTPHGYIYSQQGASQEQDAWVKTLPLQQNTLCIFGIGLGYAYRSLKNWLQSSPKHMIIFLEDDLAVLSFFLETDLAHEILSNPQVRIYFLEDSPDGKEVLKSIAWSLYPEKAEVVCLPLYEKARKSVFVEVRSTLLYEMSELSEVLDEYVGFGIPFLRNFWKNLFLLPKSYPASGLFKAFQGIPAIIAGAGPSLNSQFEKLGSLREKALIFAGGSSTNALTQAGVQPHFGGGIDPNPTQYLRLRQGLGFELPFFYRHRILNEAINLVRGPKLYLKGGDGYNISDWIEKKLKIKGRILGGGHGIANFLIEIAASLGCNPIILVGFDLAFTQGKSYASGIQEDTGIPDAELVTLPDVHGNPIQTMWKWVTEAQWISDFKKKKSKVKIINATSGGIGMKGIPTMSLDEVETKYLQTEYDLDAIVHTKVYGLDPFPCSEAQILKEAAAMYDSLTHTRHLLDEIIQELKTEDLQNNPKIIVATEKLHKEIAYEYVLQVFDRMRIKLNHLKSEFAHSNEEKSTLEKQQAIEHATFLRDAAMVNILLLSRTMRIRAEEGHSISQFHPKEEVVWA